MEYLGNTCDGNLYTDAKGKKGNEFINNPKIRKQSQWQSQLQ